MKKVEVHGSLYKSFLKVWIWWLKKDWRS